jgi:hypothetical protein
MVLVIIEDNTGNRENDLCHKDAKAQSCTKKIFNFPQNF